MKKPDLKRGDPSAPNHRHPDFTSVQAGARADFVVPVTKIPHFSALSNLI